VLKDFKIQLGLHFNGECLKQAPVFRGVGPSLLQILTIPNDEENEELIWASV
jgi:hypothetical protein